MNLSLRLLPFALASVLVLFAACSGAPGAPSEANGRDFLERKIQEQSEGAIRLVSFKKVNATANGPMTGLEFEAEIEFLKDGAWAKGGNLSPHVTYRYSPERVGSGFAAQVATGTDGWQNIQKGGHQTIKDTILFEKTERGWRAEDGHVY